jgi:glyoxylase-like metal-dependent hydrolase (beta-lactamase superfamily II)
MPVYVHELGAPHLVDPTRLMRSVRRLYGEETDALWGEVVPVPEERIRPLQGGETVGPFEVAYTPGHASHHVAFLHRPTLTAFVGDVAGVRIMPATLTMPHAPPPDIDLPAWQTSLERVRAWRPSALALPHFGLVTDVDQQLDAVWRRLNEKAEQARTLELPEFVAQSEDELAGLDPGLREVYRQTSPPEHMYLGLKRFWEQ